MPVLMCNCPECDGEGRVYRSRYGGNDPDGWMVRCDTCAGDGEYARVCEGMTCNSHATELVTFPCGSVEPYCARCAVTAREDAGMEPEPRGFW
jgi:DnaJ-class molecular chaperone